MNASEDKNLIKAAREDISNFKALYEKYVKAVFRYCYKRLGQNRDLSEDITADTFLKAIEKFEDYTYQNKPFVAWLYTIAHNMIVDYYRSKKEGNLSFEKLLIEPSEDSDHIIDNLSKQELEERVTEVAADLPDELSNIFTLRFTEELTFKEIAQLVGKSEAAVKMQFYRGLEHLKGLVIKSYISKK